MSKLEDRKKLITDLWIIGLTTLISFGIVMLAMQKGLNDFAYDINFPIVIRVFVIGLSQFAVSGLGITIVCLIRQQSFSEFGLNTKSVNTTYEVLRSSFPSNVSAYLITALCWGFFEDFNYVVIRDKISAASPSSYRFFDWGALVCAVMCILIHGAVGVTPEAVFEMVATFILIYGMLIVRKETGNAWGCIMIFFVYWNAFR